MNATWTIQVERMEIPLPVGIHPDEIEPQTVWVSLSASGTSRSTPGSLGDCFDYEPLCRWLADVWPKTPHTPLLETRINELLAFLFELDPRLDSARVGLYKARMSRNAHAVGIQRSVTRRQFLAERREARLAAAA